MNMRCKWQGNKRYQKGKREKYMEYNKEQDTCVYGIGSGTRKNVLKLDPDGIK